MGSVVLSGVLLVLLASVLGGTFALPGKGLSSVSWEELWGPFFFFVTLVLPFSIILVWHKALLTIWQQATPSELLPPLIFGLFWGLGSLLSVRAFAMAGLSISYTINRGVMVAFGSSIPLIFGGASGLPPGLVFYMLAGIMICLLGVFINGYAGSLKERELKKDGFEKSIVKGILFAGIGGLLASCMNFAFSFGRPLMLIALEQFGGSLPKATLAVWVPALAAGSIPSLGFCVAVYLKKRQKGWRSETEAGKLFAFTLLMALLHNGAIFFYGLGSDRMGKIGTGIGYAIYASGIILVGNLNGFLTGEWRGIGHRTRFWQLGGIAILVTGILILAFTKT